MRYMINYWMDMILTIIKYEGRVYSKSVITIIFLKDNAAQN